MPLVDLAIDSPLDDYALLDFGGRRRLERFGPHVLDRPARQAASKQNDPSWSADWRFTGSRVGAGEWRASRENLPKTWPIRVEQLTVHVQLLSGGQVGLFPEQLACCRWLHTRLAGARGARMLNLFGGTGVATAAAVRAGATVTHVDANRTRGADARPQEHRGHRRPLDPEDVMKYLTRAVRRGETHDLILLDPPTFGRGPKGRHWNLQRDLAAALGLVARLLPTDPLGVWVSAHAEGGTPEQLAQGLAAALPEHMPPTPLTLGIRSIDGRRLSAGYAACWPGTAGL